MLASRFGRVTEQHQASTPTQQGIRLTIPEFGVPGLPHLATCFGVVLFDGTDALKKNTARAVALLKLGNLLIVLVLASPCLC